jgi:hypothetical protein
LKSNRHRFCSTHFDLHYKCAVIDCGQPIKPGTRTCDNKDHQHLEQSLRERGKAAFQLKDRLRRAREVNAALAGQSLDHYDSDEEDLEAEYVLDQDGQPVPVSSIRKSAAPTEESPVDDAGNELDEDGRPHSEQHLGGTTRKKKIRIRLGRSYTHNEQLLVCPCGIILARETFYGAEALSSCVEFIKKTFHSSRKPDHIIFDSNCLLTKHVRKEKDPFFDDIGLAVDVFHHQNKHKESDHFCAEHCNPAAFPELLQQDGKTWYFNTSVAEQRNRWVAGYKAMCREMIPARFDFFMDQMIIEHNKMMHERLAKTRKNPRTWNM